MKRPAGFIALLCLVALSAALLGQIGTRSAPPPSSPLQDTLSVSLDPLGVSEPSSTAPISRLRADQIELNAPVVVLDTDGKGAMEDPPGPEVVAWYRFSAYPGSPGNAVFAGHVDYYRWGPAVFWHLKDLASGDSVYVELGDGTRYEYTVQWSERHKVSAAPIQAIVGPTAEESITLITCAGTFNTATGEYDEVLVVRAKRS
jgi:LPXTG-site transpeptidase (sortase) family protein